jgi:hypothetical protein
VITSPFGTCCGLGYPPNVLVTHVEAGGMTCDTDGVSPFPNLAGRPPVGPQRSVRCAPNEWAAVDRLAATCGIPKTAMARRLIVLGLQTITEQADDQE